MVNCYWKIQGGQGNYRKSSQNERGKEFLSQQGPFNKFRPYDFSPNVRAKLILFRTILILSGQKDEEALDCKV